MKKLVALVVFISLFSVAFKYIHNSELDTVNSDTISVNDQLPAWAGQLVIPGTVRVAVPAPVNERYSHLAWPKAVITENGTIILAYCAGVGHNKGGSGPAVSTSIDNGKTFSTPMLLSYYPDDDTRYKDCGNLALGIAHDGAVVLLAMAFRGNEANNIFGWRSTDNGGTWVPINTSELGPEKTGSVCGTIVQLPDQKLMVMGHYRKGSKPYETGIWQSVSSDNGQTWGTPTMVTNVNGGEPVLVRDGDRLLVFIRGRRVAATRQYIAVSDDFGETWQVELSNITAQREHTGGFAHPFAMVALNNENELISLITERPLPGSIWLWRGNTKTLDFKIDRQILEIPKIGNDVNTDYGYAWLLPTGTNHYIMFYYHGMKEGTNSIWAAEFQL